MKNCSLLLFAVALLAFGCTKEASKVVTPEASASTASGARVAKTGVDLSRVAALTQKINASLAAKGKTMQVDKVWFFTKGLGVDPYQSLRIGSSWPKSNLTYVLDASDYTADLAPATTEKTLVDAYESWNSIQNTNLKTARIADDGRNNDYLDALTPIVQNGDTVGYDIYDQDWVGLKQDNLPADIVVGGWLDPEYFSLGMGSADIIAITWTFSDADGTINGTKDGYPDIVYVEQYYNKAFKWAVQGSKYLDFTPTAVTDLQSIAVHENGHALGLDHFGGPVGDNQPFKLQPNQKVYNPEAVMNPGYLGGEKRIPFPTDVAGLRTMY